jgi:hypothetical protein
MMKPMQGGLRMGSSALISIGLAMLVVGCAGGNAELGPNPGGGFNIGAEHGDVGSINPPKGAADAL